MDEDGEPGGPAARFFARVPNRLASTHSGCHGCLMCFGSTELKRRMRTRSPGGVAGASGDRSHGHCPSS